MFCSNCGGELEAGASFCQHCGASVAEATVNTAGAGVSAVNPNLEKAKDISKGYFSFIKDHLKAPIRHGFSVNGSHWINGLITLILFSLLPAIATYLIASAFSFFRKPSLGDALFLPMLYMAITLLIIIGVIFLVSKLARSTASFQDVLARFGALLIIPTLFMLLLFVFGILQISSSVLVSFTVFGFGISFLVSLVLTSYSFSKGNNGGIDSFYSILLVFLGVSIALSIFGDQIFGRLTSMIGLF